MSDYSAVERYIPALARYLVHGIPTGGFLHAVLCNDLQGAVGRADEQSLRDLPDIVKFMYNYFPSIAYGSPQKVRGYLEFDKELFGEGCHGDFAKCTSFADSVFVVFGVKVEDVLKRS